MGQRWPDSTHPDSRAILYEEATYGKRKIAGFLSALDGFQSAMKLPKILSSVADGCPAGLVRRLVTFQEDGGEEEAPLPSLSVLCPPLSLSSA